MSLNSIEQAMQPTPRVHPASLDSQPSPPPPPPPSPMNLSHEFLMFQCGNHDTKEKLEFYQNFIMRLLVELETLSETVCTSCQPKSASSPTTRSGNQLFAAPNDSTRPLTPHRVDDSLPAMVETDIFWTPAASPGSTSPPIIEKIVSDSSSLVEMTTEWNQPSNETDDPMFYAEQDALADPTINVTFAYSFRHKGWVRCVSFSRDERYLAVGTGVNDKSGSIVIYEVESHKKYCELREHASQYGSYTRPIPWNLCFSSDGRYLAVVNPAKRIIIWDVPKKRIRNIFHGSHQTYDVRFSPDGRLVGFWGSGGVFVLNMRDNSRRLASEGRCFDFNPDGRLIATGRVDVLLILDVRTGKAVKRWNRYGTVLHRVKFTSDGRGLMCVYTDMVEQWDLSDTEPVLIRKLDVQTHYLSRTSISPDHRLLACNDVFLDTDGAKRQGTCKGHLGVILSVDFSAAGTYLAIGDYYGFVSLWKYARS